MNPIVRLLPDKSTFHSQKKEYISQSTRKVKTQNNNVFILEVRDTPLPQIYFSRKTLTSLLTNQNLITVDSKRTEQKIIRLSQMFEPEQTPSNADAYFESTKIKNPTFLKHCLFKQ